MQITFDIVSQAVKNNVFGAHAELAEYYLHERDGIKFDRKQFLRCCTLGLKTPTDPHAVFLLAYAQERGRPYSGGFASPLQANINYKKAIDFHNKLIKQYPNMALSPGWCWGLGTLYERGKGGLKVDLEAAAYWYLRAEAQLPGSAGNNLIQLTNTHPQIVAQAKEHLAQERFYHFLNPEAPVGPLVRRNYCLIL